MNDDIPLSEFKAFSKIARLSRDIIIAEKIDGTNAQIAVLEDGTVLAGSRTKWLAPEKHLDNFGFAVWVKEHEMELRMLGTGRHYGEWWGLGIQRGYGLSEKRLSLFRIPKTGIIPPCCSVVPTLYTGEFTTERVNTVMNGLSFGGSIVSPGFKKPEGIVIFHTASGQLFKKTIENDEKPKGQNE